MRRYPGSSLTQAIGWSTRIADKSHEFYEED